MKKYLFTAITLFVLVALVACSSDSETPELTPVSDLPSEEDYSIIINGVGFVDTSYGNTDDVYTLAGEQYPTHVTMWVLGALGLEAMAGGSQIALLHDSAGMIGVNLSVVNYLTFGADRVVVGINDTFMADNDYFTQYMPLSLVRDLGFDVHFEGGRVYINGEFDASLTIPHPLALALENFIADAEGETKALVPNVGGNVGVLAIEFINGFAEATLFVFTGFEVISKEIGSIEGFPFSVGFTSDGWGSLVIVTGDGGNSSYTMLGVATNPVTREEEIIYHFTIYAETEFLDFDGNYRIDYYRFNGGWLEGIEGGRHFITEEEFLEIRSSMGDRISSWREFSDNTESILAWVVRLD